MEDKALPDDDDIETTDFEGYDEDMEESDAF